MNIVAMIPARIGSERLKFKNLALINGKPLIYYVIKQAKLSKIFNKIYINSDDDIFAEIAKRYKVNFFKRNKKLGSSDTKSDEVVMDFINNIKCDVLVWLNPIAPLQKSSEIKEVVNYFISKKLNSLITTNKIYRHAIFKKKNLNFKINENFQKTQELYPVEEFVYSIMMWTSDSFIKSYKRNKGSILHGKFKTYNVSDYSGIIVKNHKDLKIVENLIKLETKNIKIKYDKLVRKINV